MKIFFRTAIFVMAMAISLLIGMTACMKTEPEKTITSSEISQADLDMAKKLDSFIDRMSNPVNLKSSRMMETDSALWNMEAAINYMYANIPSEYEYLAIDSSSTTITLQVNAGMCSETEISNAFGQLLSEMESYYNIHVGVKIVATDLRATPDPSTGNFQLTLQYLVAKEPTFEPSIAQPSLVPFDEGWWPCFGNGTCSNTDKGNDLATKIQEKINTYYQQKHQLGSVGYWTGIEIRTIEQGDAQEFLNPNDVKKYDNDRDYLIYCTYWKNCPHCLGTYWLPCTYWTCLPKEECNFYLNSTFNVISTLQTPGVGIRPANKEVIQIITAQGNLCPCGEDAYHFHTFSIKYGMPYKRADMPQPYPLYQ